MSSAENPHAGTGSVVLDIGGDIGALIVTTPAAMVDLEVEIIPTGTDTRPAARIGTDESTDHHHHADGSHHHDGADHAHDSHGDHRHDGVLPPHVAVVPRPAPDGTTIHSLVYGELLEGTYDLYVRPNGPIRLTATVIGGQVTEARWPDGD